jgi:hypothetical protein
VNGRGESTAAPIHRVTLSPYGAPRGADKWARVAGSPRIASRGLAWPLLPKSAMSLSTHRFLALCLFGAAACGQDYSEPPLTPASYTPPPTDTPRRATKAKAAPAAPRADARQRQKSPSLAEAPPPPVLTPIEGLDSRTAITLARCQLETRCNNVGEEKEYVTEEDCIARLEPGTERELEAGECPRRIPSVRIGACMEAIRREKCDSARDLAHIGECSSAVLCGKQ